MQELFASNLRLASRLAGLPRAMLVCLFKLDAQSNFAQSNLYDVGRRRRRRVELNSARTDPIHESGFACCLRAKPVSQCLLL